MKKNKENKERFSSYYNRGIEKERLKLYKEAIRIRDSPDYSKEQKKEAFDAISRRKQRLNEKEIIDKKSKELYKKSFRGKLESGIERGYQKLAQASRERVVSRQVLKKSNMGVVIPNYKAPSILGDENRFFKGEFDKEKRSMFFG